MLDHLNPAQTELLKWGLYTVIPVVVTFLGKWWGKVTAVKPELKKYEKYLPIAQAVIQDAAVICLASEQDRKAKAVEILQETLGIPEAGADYIAQQAYVLYKAALEKATKK